MLQRQLRAATGGSGFCGHPVGSCINFVDFCGTGGMQIGNAPGCEGVRIVSAAGPLAVKRKVG